MTESPASNSARILIVDDEELNVDLLEQELSDLGFGTDSAYGGKEALEKVTANRPDLILLDVMMPDIDGITVCRMLKEDPATQLIPIVIMTALHETEDRVRGIEAGADDFLTKPVDDRELLARINTLLKTKRVVDQTVGELRSASAQLERMGAHDEDLSVLVIELEPDSEESSVSDAFAFMSGRFRSAYTDVLAMFNGQICDSDDQRMVAIVRAEDQEGHPRAAAEAAYAVLAETDALNRSASVSPIRATVGIASGSASIGSTRVEHADGPRWELSVDGPVVGNAMRAASRSPRGLVFADDEFLTRMQHQFGADPSSGALTQTAQADESPEQPERGSLLWPAEFSELESAAHSKWGVRDLYLHRVLSGKSGALVFAVDVDAQEFSGQAILKLTDLDDPDWSESDEAARHRRAIEANPTYAEHHLPEIVATLERDQRLAVLATIAARGLEYSLPWAHCDFDVQSAASSQLSDDLLEEWNSGYRFDDGLLAPQDLLSSWLKYRLDPEQSRLWDLLQSVCSIEPEAPTFFFDGRWYPNPLAFALGSIDLGDKLGLRAIVGNTHGDLHGFNVLVGSENGALKYHLIDLAFYQPDAYLLYDHAYFEISHLIHQRGNLGLGEWMMLVDSLERGSTPRADDVGLLQLLATFRKQVLGWIDRREPNRLSYLDSQYMLARVGAGLNFTNKGMPLDLRIRSLLYTAHCLKTFLKFHKIDWPKQGQVLNCSSAN